MTGPVRDLLRDRSFQLMFWARAISFFGNAILPIALAFAVLGQATPSAATRLGLILAVRSVAQVVFLLIGGAVADRFPRRQVMVGAEAMAGIAQAATAGLFFLGSATLPALLVLAAVNGAAWALFWPASTGLVPHLVPMEALTAANSLLRLSMNLTAVVGSATAGALVALAGPHWALAVGSVTFLLSAGLLGAMRTRPDNPAAHEHALRALRTGWREFRSRRWVWATVAQFSLVNACFQGPLMVLGPVVADRRFGGAPFWATMLALHAAGLAVGSLAALRTRSARPMLTATAATFGFAPMYIALGWNTPRELIGAAMLLGGFSASLFNILWNTSLQTRIPPHVLSRVSSYDALGSFALGPAGAALAAPLALRFGTTAVFLGCGILLTLASAAVLTSGDTQKLTRPDLHHRQRS
ncbi:MFS transporter [Actinomadura rupiterrae]|uniref:MFS transporter n=1 Tax=Actinomadura rupiterrae TaxID=559627 RepID=UPI0020A338AE|nr:MFS transporter [Actinomadura rupiterrae]MCP2340676.1 MFS family permease [Actinomadura rupiterrae]